MIKVWLISLVASLGGVAVFVGLGMEKLAEREKDGYQSVNDFKKSKSRRKVGERLVRWGVFAEMILGFFVALWDGWQTFSTASGNMPVSSISADADIFVAPAFNFSVTNKPDSIKDAMLGTSFISPPQNDILNNPGTGVAGAVLQFGGANFWNPYLELQCVEKPWRVSVSNKAFVRGTGIVPIYSLPMHFEWNLEKTFAAGETASELNSQIKHFRLFFEGNGLRDCEIVGGNVTLRLNGSVSQTFPIPPQFFFGVRTNSAGKLEAHMHISDSGEQDIVLP
jgi:hypothetical protein